MNKIQTSSFPVLIALLFLTHINSFAQKVDDIQSGNVWITKPKIDGDLSDWKLPLKAENKSTGVSYTLANDSKNIYLAIQTKESAVITKILMGGISLSINPDGKKKEKDAFSVTYPIINQVRRAPGANGFGNRSAQAGGFQQRTSEQRDSLLNAQAKSQLANAKDIKVLGFNDIQDSLISIYNEYGIKATAKMDDNGTFNYELAIPLSLLKMDISKPKEFAYNIKLNGLQINRNPDAANRTGGNGGNLGARPAGGGGFGGGTRPAGGFGGAGGGSRNGIDFQALTSPTDLWGKYILSEK